MRPSHRSAAGALLLALPWGDARAGEALDQTLALVEARTGGAMDPGAADRAAVEGLLSWLDAQNGATGSRLLDEAAYQAQLAWLRGEREGLGAEFAVVAGQGVLITEVFEGSAAARAGLRVGDLVVALDDQPFTGLPAAAILALVKRGGAGGATLDVRREQGELRRIKVQRAPYRVGAIQAQAGDGAWLVRVKFFGEGTGAALARALAQVPGDAPIVLDLRDNEGGSIDEAVGAASCFLPAGTPVLQRVGPDGTVSTVRSRAPGRSEPPRVAILVNQGTLGAAEALAVALQEQRVAQLVGTRTGGLAHVPSHHRLASGLVLQLVDTSLRSPAGRAWTGAGLAPDLVVQAPAIPVVGPPGKEPPDLQREAALRLLSGY
jgi:carboxyl-terminal processing protease